MADILEKYGVASAIDVSELKQDDFIALEALGLKPFVLMKIKRWSTSGGVTDVLPSSSTVPAAALTSSVPLTVGDGVDNAQHGTENESDGSVSNDTGERESDEDCVLIDAMETVIAHEEAGSTSGKRAATGGTQDEASSKKTKSNMTAEQETFVQKFKAAPSKVDKLRKLAVRHFDGRGSSKHKNGARRADVKPATLTKRLKEFPTHFLKITVGQLFCCVQCSPTHPTPVPPSVSLASSIQLSMPIRVDLTLTTCSYRYSHSLTVESRTLLTCLLRSEG